MMCWLWESECINVKINFWRTLFICPLLCLTTDLSAQSFKQTIDSLTQLAATDQPDTLRLYIWLDLSRNLQRFRPEDADSVATLVEKKSKQLGLLSFETKAYTQRGNIQFISGNLNYAAEFYSLALQIAVFQKDTAQIAQLNNKIGQSYRKLGIYDKALEFAFKAIELYGASGNIEGVSDGFNTIALTYKSNKQYNDAIKYFKKSINLRKTLGDAKRIAESYNNIGLVYKGLKKWKKAKSHLRTALQIADNLKLHSYRSSIYNNLASIHLNTDSLPEARKTAIMALNYSRLTHKRTEVAIAYFNLAEYYVKTGEFKLAYNTSLKAYMASLETGSLEIQSKVLGQLVSINEASGNIASALDYLKRKKAVDDSIKSVKVSQRVTEQRLQYEFEKRISIQKHQNKLEQLEQEKEIEYQRFSKLLTSSLLVIALIGLAFIIVSLRRSIKHKKELEEQNSRIKQQAEELTAQAERLSDANSLITNQKEEIEKQHKRFTDNINYARQIQMSISPNVDVLRDVSTDVFLLNLPKDIVSGDFFWCKNLLGFTAFAVSDCTGHGVSAGFLTMLGLTYLDDIFDENINQEHIDAGIILTQLRARVKRSLAATGKAASTQGMDIALCIIDHAKQEFQFAGANNPLFWFKSENGDYKLTEIKPDRMPIGAQPKAKERFTNHNLKLNKGDWLYLFSDGYTDQFGGAQGTKYLKKRFKVFLAENIEEDGNTQKNRLLTELKEWMGTKQKQIDDITILGIQL